ncbi:hypothetical protein [Roseibium sp.]|uniref:hypothetical protein n=1 Tax=Roseibium sp. TaxID=1936156 RepID=UPI003A96A331
MVKEVDGVKYRTSVLKIVATQKDLFCKAYCAFAKAKGQKAGIAFLEDTAKFDPKSQFAVYFAPKAKAKISAIASSLRQKADTLATLEDWKASEWKKIYSDARDAVAKDIEKATTDAFFKSDVFQAVHKKYAKKKEADREEMAQRRKGVRFVGNPNEKLANRSPREGVRLTKGQ